MQMFSTVKSEEVYEGVQLSNTDLGAAPSCLFLGKNAMLPFPQSLWKAVTSQENEKLCLFLVPLF